VNPDPLEVIGAQLPGRFPVVVIMQRTGVSGNRWIDHHWEAIGIAVDGGESGTEPGPRLIHRDGDDQRALHDGFTIRLQIDECESYYHNLLAPEPCAFVIASCDDDGVPVPRLVSLSFDEAHAYLEGEEELYSVPLPPEIGRWCEAFVLAHYVPQPRRKRKLEKWSESPEGRR